MFRPTGFVETVSAVKRASDLAHLRQILGEESIEVGSDTALEMAVGAIAEVSAGETGGVGLRNSETNRDRYRKAASLSWFAEQISLARRDTKGFKTLINHLRLLASARSFSHCAPSDSLEKEQRIEDKLFEIQIALGLFPWATNVDLESPTASAGGSNPDILFEFLGKNWGIACKNLRSRDPRRFRTQVENGIEQLNKSPATRKVVFVNLTNIIDHNLFFRVVSESENSGVQCEVWPSEKAISHELTAQIFRTLRFSDETSQSEYRRIRDENVNSRIHIAMYCATVAPVLWENKPVPMLTNLILHADLRIPDSDFQSMFGFFGKVQNATIIG